MEDRARGEGIAWTKLHRPVRIRALERVVMDKAQRIENQTTLDMMATFGAAVRGGYYISDDQVRRTLPGVAMVTRTRGPSIARVDPRIWSRNAEDLRLSPAPTELPLLPEVRCARPRR